MIRDLERELIAWKQRDHLPLLLRGARQVGKSFLVEQFGKAHFEDTVIVDFEKKPGLKEVFVHREPLEILPRLEVIFGKKIIPEKTLLFLDEIQECPEALISLRYFKELLPKLHVIAAGSLLEFLLQSQDYSFPVGRVEFLYLRPLSFKEFLHALAPVIAESLPSLWERASLSEIEHQTLLNWVRKYLFVGGMPAAVQVYQTTNSLFQAQQVHHWILQAYESDLGKYATSVSHKHLQLIFQRAPALVGNILKYSHFSREVRARDLEPALKLLVQAGLLGQIFATTASGLPLHAHLKSHQFKLQFLDIGLLQTACGVDAESFFQEDLLQINQGILAEQLVGQELLAYHPPYQNLPLLFWKREEGGQAEVDFVQAIGSSIVPIEVKAGTTGTLRSLRSFLDKKKGSLGVRVSEHPVSLQDPILSIPFYLLSVFPAIYRSFSKK